MTELSDYQRMVEKPNRERMDRMIQNQQAKIAQLEGTLRYIAAQAKAGHAGALRVIQSNAEAALDGSLAKMQAAVNAAESHRGEN